MLGVCYPVSSVLSCRSVSVMEFSRQPFFVVVKGPDRERITSLKNRAVRFFLSLLRFYTYRVLTIIAE